MKIENKQTAVDIFHDGIIDLLRNASVNSNTVAKLWMRCKDVERKQIEDAFNHGQQIPLSITQNQESYGNTE